MRAILTYHSIDESGSPISLGASVWRSHVRFLASGRVRVVTLAQLPLAAVDADAVAITFDDGFENFARIALPMLRDAGLPATVFAVSDHVGGRNDWGGRAAPGIPALPLMDWDTLARLREAGIEIGAHSRRHPDLTRLAVKDAEDEVVGCRIRLAERLGGEPSSFAYPFGCHSRAIADLVRTHYRHAVTTDFRTVSALDDPVLLPRLDAFYFRSAGQLERWGSLPFIGRLWLRAGGRRVRALMARRAGAQ